MFVILWNVPNYAPNRPLTNLEGTSRQAAGVNCPRGGTTRPAIKPEFSLQIEIHLRAWLLWKIASHNCTSWWPSSAVAKSTGVFRPLAMCS